MGGRGSSGKSKSSGGKLNSSQQAVKTMLDSANITIELDINKIQYISDYWILTTPDL